MDKRYVVYHSQEWNELVMENHQGYGWVTWSVDDGIATMVLTRY